MPTIEEDGEEMKHEMKTESMQGSKRAGGTLNPTEPLTDLVCFSQNARSQSLSPSFHTISCHKRTHKPRNPQPTNSEPQDLNPKPQTLNQPHTLHTFSLGFRAGWEVRRYLGGGGKRALVSRIVKIQGLR